MTDDLRQNSTENGTDLAPDIVARIREQANAGYIDEHEVMLREAADEIERLRECLQHAIDHVGKWQLFTSEERQTILAEYEQVVSGG